VSEVIALPVMPILNRGLGRHQDGSATSAAEAVAVRADSNANDAAVGSGAGMK
jgi:hypothetical protein